MLKQLEMKKLAVLGVVLALFCAVLLPGHHAQAASSQGSYLGVKTEAKVYDDFENDIWLQYEQKEMALGDTADLYPWRVPQAITNETENDVERPTFHFEIIAGDSVTLDQTASTEKAVVTAKKAGTTVVKVTYDAFNHSAGKAFGASSVVNTAYAVYTVGETGTVTPTLSDSIANLRSYDTQYYTDGDTTPLTFSVTAPQAKSIVVTCNGLVVEPSNGSYTVNLENRSNIIGVVATDNAGNTKSLYRVIDARKIEVTVANQTNASKGSTIEVGDTAALSFKGITLPVYKLASIYNPTWYSETTENKGTAVVYTANQDLGTLKGISSGQWNLATSNTITVTPSQAGDLTLSGGNIETSWWGRALGWDKTQQGKDSQTSGTNIPMYKGNFSALPSITIPVQAKSSEVAVEKVTLPESKTVKVGTPFTVGPVVVTPENATNKDVEWSVHYKAWGTDYTPGSTMYIQCDKTTGEVTINKTPPTTWTDLRVRATSKANGEIYGECALTVEASSNPVAVTGVSVTPESATIKVGGTTDLKATVTPTGATNKKVAWSTSNPEIAAVDAATGTVTGVAEGTATITATTEDGEKTATVAITVSNETLAVYTIKTTDGKDLVAVDSGEKDGVVPIYKVAIPSGTTQVVFTVNNTDYMLMDGWNPLVEGGATETIKIELGKNYDLYDESFFPVQILVFEEVAEAPELTAAKKAIDEAIGMGDSLTQAAVEAAEAAIGQLDAESQKEIQDKIDALNAAVKAVEDTRHQPTKVEGTDITVSADNLQFDHVLKVAPVKDADRDALAALATTGNPGMDVVLPLEIHIEDFKGNIITDPELTELYKKGITITISADLSAYGDNPVVKIAHIKDGKVEKDPIIGTYNAEQKTVTFTVSSFSDFVLMAQKADTTNPVAPGTSGTGAGNSSTGSTGNAPASQGTATTVSNVKTGIAGGNSAGPMVGVMMLLLIIGGTSAYVYYRQSR